MKLQFLFETTKNHDYVSVLADSALVQGDIASLDAGSINPGIYYQIGGGGVNGLFARALGATLAASVNTSLQAAYDARFGAGAWQKAQDPSAPPPLLTSFFIPLPANASSTGHSVGKSVAGIVYSVGPMLPTLKSLDPKQYEQIYVDALAGVAEHNAAVAKGGNGSPVVALRLVMVSTGIYGPQPPDGKEAEAVRCAVAGLILDAVCAVAKTAAAKDLPTTMLINCATVAGRKTPSYEIDAFTNAAEARGITVTSEGFELVC